MNCILWHMSLWLRHVANLSVGLMLVVGKGTTPIGDWVFLHRMPEWRQVMAKSTAEVQTQEQWFANKIKGLQENYKEQTYIICHTYPESSLSHAAWNFACRCMMTCDFASSDPGGINSKEERQVFREHPSHYISSGFAYQEESEILFSGRWTRVRTPKLSRK